MGKQNIGRNHDVVRLGIVDDPIICRIEGAIDNHHFEIGVIWQVQSLIRDQYNGKFVALGNPVNFILNGATIGINVDLGRSALSLLTLNSQKQNDGSGHQPAVEPAAGVG